MRDLIWTIIILWLVWRLYESFKTINKASVNKQGFYNPNQQQRRQQKEGEVKIDKNAPKQKTYIKPEDGEYVDFEEVK